MLQMMHNLRFGGFGASELIYYDKQNIPIACSITMKPILSEDMYGDFMISHYLGVLKKLEFDGNGVAECALKYIAKTASQDYEWIIADELNQIGVENG
jgi:hypothetical protein